MSLRILVADDVHDSANAMAALLRLYGHNVSACYDGRSALAAAGELHPDVMMLDLTMPGMDGLDVCKILRQRDWARRVTMIAYTGWARDEDIERARQAGFDLHIARPAKIDELLHALDEAARRHSLLRRESEV